MGIQKRLRCVCLYPSEGIKPARARFTYMRAFHCRLSRANAIRHPATELVLTLN